MRILDIYAKPRRIQINLDHVDMWSVEEGQEHSMYSSFNIYMSGSETPLTIWLKRDTTEDVIFVRLRKALAPLYESRQGTVLGIYLTLDLRDLQ